jgi:hypothetical protein
MRTVKISLLAFSALIIALGASFVPVRHAAATSAVKFTITVGGAFLRDEPSLIGATTQPVFAKQVYGVTGRAADNSWVQLDAPKPGTWILAAFGLITGDLPSVPVVKVALKTPRAGPAAATPRWVPAVSARARQLYQQALRAGKDPSMFTVAGDCNSETTAYLGRLAAGTFQLPKGQEYLQATITRFAPSFHRASLATHGSFGAASMFDGDWADPGQCKAGEGPLACELRVSRAGVVFIALGTGDQFAWKDFEKNYRAVVEYALKAGVVPVLVTKADDLESQAGATSGYIDDVIRKLGKEYNVPVLDFWAATRGLPNYGLIDEGNQDFHMTPAGSDTRIQATLQTLAAISGR